MATLPGLRVGVSLDSATFTTESRRINASVNAMGRNIERQSAVMTRGFTATATAAKSLATSLGVGLGIGAAAGLVSLTRATVANAAAMSDAAGKIGLTTTALQELRFAAEQSGVAQRTLDMGLQRFSRRLGEAASGSGVLAGILRDNDIAIRTSTGAMRPLVDVLADYADLVAATENPQEQLRLAFAAFDSEAAGLVNVLRQGSSGLEEFARQAREAGIATDAQIQALADADDAIARLSHTIATTFTSALGGAILATEDLIEHLSELSLFGGEGGRFTLAERMFEVSAAVADQMAVVAAAEGDAKRIAEARLQTLRLQEQALADQLAALQALERGERSRRSAIAAPTPPAIEPPVIPLSGGSGGSGLLTGPSIGPAPMSRAAAQSFGLGIASVEVGGAADFAGQLDILRQMGQAQALLNRQIALAPPAIEQVSVAYDLAAEAQQLFARSAASGISDAVFEAKSLGQALEDVAKSFGKAILEALAFRAIMAGIDAFAGSFGGSSGAALAGASAGGGPTPLFSPNIIPPGRAAGGPVSPGMVYQVGERGPEWFVPNVAGQIVPNGGGGGGGGGGFTIIDQRGANAPPIETSIDARGMATAVIRSELASASRDGTLPQMLGLRRKGIARG